MGCPVLICGILLRVHYGMSGTDIGYAATRERRQDASDRRYDEGPVSCTARVVLLALYCSRCTAR
eukprot:2380550-Rhodomonas_salina.1